MSNADDAWAPLVKGIEMYARWELECQAQMYEQGTIFSRNDPELRALELAASRRIRALLNDGSGCIG